jgi:hypothetical protein
MSLSPGQWYKSVPKGLVENLKFRLAILKAAENDPVVQAGLREICRQDFLFFANVFVYQYNPTQKKKSQVRLGPWITWPRQEKLILKEPGGILWCYENDRSGVVEKSRELGATWLFLIFQVWLCLFQHDVEAMNISLSKDAVDDGSKNCLFSKLRFIIEHLPDWMKGEVESTSCLLKFKRTGSEIYGAASTGKFGVGSRGSVIFVDEFPLIREAKQVRERTASTANCRFFNGTHQGTGTEFYELTQTPEVHKLQIHWVHHPQKNKSLYSYDVTAAKFRYWRYDEPTDSLIETKGPEPEFPEHIYIGDEKVPYRPVKDGTPTGGPFPGIRSPWYDWKVREIGSQEGAASELDIDPAGSSEQFFSPSTKIAELRSEHVRPPLWQGEVVVDDGGNVVDLLEHRDGPFSLWLPFLAGEDRRIQESYYAAGVDVGGGTGRSNSCVSIADATTGHKVAEYVHNRIGPDDFGRLVVALCRWFHNAYLTWENRGPGSRVGDKVRTLGYANFRKPKMYDAVSKTSIFAMGWAPERGAKLNMLLEYKSALFRGDYVNCSDKALAECLVFKYDESGEVVHTDEVGGTGSGAKQHHGDLVIGDGLSWLGVKESGRLVRAKKHLVVEEVHPEDPMVLMTPQGRRDRFTRDQEAELPRHW